MWLLDSCRGQRVRPAAPPSVASAVGCERCGDLCPEGDTLTSPDWPVGGAPEHTNVVIFISSKHNIYIFLLLLQQSLFGCSPVEHL